MSNHPLIFSKNEDLTHVSGVKTSTLTYNQQIKIMIIKGKKSNLQKENKEQEQSDEVKHSTQLDG